MNQPAAASMMPNSYPQFKLHTQYNSSYSSGHQEPHSHQQLEQEFSFEPNGMDWMKDFASVEPNCQFDLDQIFICPSGWSPSGMEVLESEQDALNSSFEDWLDFVSFEPVQPAFMVADPYQGVKASQKSYPTSMMMIQQQQPQQGLVNPSVLNQPPSQPFNSVSPTFPKGYISSRIGGVTVYRKADRGRT